jgi:hypothetical protein
MKSSCQRYLPVAGQLGDTELGQVAPDLLASPPDIRTVDIIAVK